MAITKITKITKTPDLAVAYVLRNKVEEIKTETEVNEEVPHRVWKNDRTGKMYVEYYTIASYKDCSPNSPYAAFEERQNKFQGQSKSGVSRSKNHEEPLMYHLKQSFNGFEVDYYTANEIGRKLADEVFGDYVVLITTHGNTGNVHNHLLISAWDSEGHKLNDNLALIRNIRKVSDRLCEEYGLSVLEDTREMNLISYKDKDGNTHYYEPTDRKNAMLKKRDKGELSRDDISSYRNSKSYSDKEHKRITNIEEIVADINTILPTCESYEDLLTRLRKIGYEIRSKKKNGEWLRYVSFKAPTHDKATRDKSLDEDGFYLRENLTAYISEQARLRIESEKSNSDVQRNDAPENILYFSDYNSDDVSIDDINEDWKKIRDNNGRYSTVRRSAFEHKVVRDTKATYRSLRNTVSAKDSAERREFIETQKARIRNNLKCLNYTEKNNIYSYNQILTLYQNYKKKYDLAIVNFSKVEASLKQLQELRTLPDKIAELQSRINANKGNFDYLIESFEDDKSKLESYKQELKKYKIEREEDRQVFFDKISIIEHKQKANREYISDAINQMNELENCIMTYTRIDATAGLETRNIISTFNNLKGLDDSDTASRNRSDERIGSRNNKERT